MIELKDCLQIWLKENFANYEFKVDERPKVRNGVAWCYIDLNRRWIISIAPDQMWSRTFRFKIVRIEDPKFFNALKSLIRTEIRYENDLINRK